RHAAAADGPLDAGSLRALLPALADRGQPGDLVAASGPAVPDAGHLAARLSRARGGSAEALRDLGATRAEGAERRARGRGPDPDLPAGRELPEGAGGGGAPGPEPDLPADL